MTLLEYLPERLGRSPETAAIQNAVQPEVDMLWAVRNWLLEQLNPRTASGVGLEMWESAMGIQPAAEDGLEQRRGRIVAKIRGMGVVNATLLKAVVESFRVEAVEVDEYPRENWVDIRYSASDAVPHPGIDEITRAILDVLPAHLGMRISAEALPAVTVLRAGGVMSTVTRMPIPEMEDALRFEDTLRLGGSMALIHRVPIPEIS